MNRIFHTERKHWFLAIFAILGVSLASCGGGGGSEGSPVTGPAAPSDLRGIAASSSAIDLTWTDNSNDEVGFRVYRGTTSTTVSTLVATVGLGITSYTDTGLTASTTYYYKVTAYNSSGESAASNVAGVPTSPLTIPAAPTNLQATAASSSAINLTWTDNSNNEDGFKIYRGTTLSSVTTLVASVGPGITSFTDNTGLAASTTYYYQVTAYNSAGESAASNVAYATTNPPAVTIPAAPTNLQTTAVSGTAINLAWSDNSNNEDGFRVFRGTGANPSSFTKIGADLGANVTTFTDTTASGSTTYVYRVTAFNGAGESSPAQSAAVTTPLGPTSVDAGNRHSLALMSDGTVRAWGDNYWGELGDGTTTARLTPVPVSGLTNMVVAISAGDGHSLALMNNGTIVGWGENSFGEVGNGDSNTHYTPVTVANLTNVSAISAGGGFSLALKNDGTVWAWGLDNVGQLGNGTNDNALVPVQVQGPGGVGFLNDVAAISAGGGFSLALKNDGTVWAWGLNDVGQLGNGTTDNSLTPVQVNLAGVVVAISAGEAHSLALLNNGTIWAWGDDYFGELGDGSTLIERPTPVQVLQSPGGTNFTNVKAVSAGGYFSIALKNDGTVWVWGSSQKGQIGDGRGENDPAPTPVQVNPLTNVQAISNGEDQSLALRGDINTLWAWGGNAYGQIGDGTTTDALVPVPVAGF